MCPTQSTPDLVLFEDEEFRLEQCDSCPLPGYLILRLKGPAQPLGGLTPELAGRLGAMIARIAGAIEQATGAARVYCLSYCEVEPRLHFHLFPRTAWLCDEYCRAHPGATGPVDGPALFQWARQIFRPGFPLPPEAPGLMDTCLTLRRLLAQPCPG